MALGMPLELATDGRFREAAGFPTPPRAGVVTALEASGQVRVAMDDPDGGDVLAWPLNGFTYAVGAVVYVAFAANSPDGGVVIGSKAPLPALDGSVTAHDHDADYSGVGHMHDAYLNKDGTVPLTGEWDAGEDKSIRAERLEARDNEGLRIEDDGGNLGVFVADGGNVGMRMASPQGPLHLHNGVGGLIFVTKTGIDGTVQTILPNGTGDVTMGLAALIVVTDGTIGTAGQTTLSPGGNQDIGCGTLTVRFSVAADGSLTVKRQSGTGTVALVAVWV